MKTPILIHWPSIIEVLIVINEILDMHMHVIYNTISSYLVARNNSQIFYEYYSMFHASYFIFLAFFKNFLCKRGERPVGAKKILRSGPRGCCFAKKFFTDEVYEAVEKTCCSQQKNLIISHCCDWSLNLCI